MPLPWKKSKSGRMSRFVSDFQQSPKHGGSLVVETGFPTSLIDLFVKNRDRLKKTSPKRSKKLTAPPIPPKRRVLPPPSPPLPQNLDPPPVTEEPKIEESSVGAENRNDGGGGNRRGCCVLMVVAFKVFVVAVLALSTKKLAVGITLSAFALLFLEFAATRVFTLLNICPNATEVRLDSLIGKLIGTKKRRNEIVEEESTSTTHERKNRVFFEIVEESSEEIPQLEKKDSDVVEEKEVQTIRDVVFKKEKSKSSKLKSKIVKKIVPKKLRSYKKKRKMMKIKKGEEEVEQEVEVIVEEEDESTTEVSSLYSDERVESEVSERDEVSSNPPLLESCCEEIGDEGGESKGGLTKAIVLIVIVLAGLLSGKVVAIVLTLSWCLILRVFFCKSQTSL